MATKQYSDAYNTGYAAAASGEPRDANPYPNESWERGEWNAGWDDMDD